MNMSAINVISEEGETAHRAGAVVYRIAGQTDNTALLALLSENEMDSWIRLSLERRPDYFAGERLMGESRAVIAHESATPSRIVGMYSCRWLPVYVNGQPQQAMYLGELRVARQHRCRIGALRQGFTSIQHLMPGEWQRARWFTSIASGNRPARRLLEAGLPGFPGYTPLGEVETLVLSTRQGKANDLWRQAERKDIPALADFYNRQSAAWQFAPVLGESWLAGLDGSNGLCLQDFRLMKSGVDIHGCVAVWDQRGFRQTVVQGYRPPLAQLRGPYNLWARLTRQPWLPAIGERLDYVFLAFAAFDTQGHATAIDGIRDALSAAGQKGAQLGVLGLSLTNPLRDLLKTSLRGQRYRTCIESVDQSVDSLSAIDARPPQPEVAIL